MFVSSTTISNHCFLLSLTSRLFSGSSYQYQNFVVKAWRVELKTIFVCIRLKGMIVFRKREMCHRTLQMKKMIVCRYSPLRTLVAPDCCLFSSSKVLSGMLFLFLTWKTSIDIFLNW